MKKPKGSFSPWARKALRSGFWWQWSGMNLGDKRAWNVHSDPGNFITDLHLFWKGRVGDKEQYSQVFLQDAQNSVMSTAAVLTSWFVFLLSQSVRSCQSVTSTVPHNKPHTQQLHTNNTTRWNAWLWGRICPTADQLSWVNIHISNQVLNIFLQ